MTDERDERRLRDVKTQQETGGTAYHGDGTSSNVGSDYGPNHGRASTSDGREYREDLFGTMRRDVSAEPIAVPRFESPTFPSSPIQVNLPNIDAGTEMKLGLLLVTMSALIGLYHVVDGWLAQAPEIFWPSVGVISFVVYRWIYGQLRWVYFGLVAVFIIVKAIIWWNQPPLPTKPAAPVPTRQQASQKH